MNEIRSVIHISGKKQNKKYKRIMKSHTVRSIRKMNRIRRFFFFFFLHFSTSDKFDYFIQRYIST